MNNKELLSRILYGIPAKYWRKDMLNLFITAICVDIALENSQKANYIYKDIVNAWDKPDCKKLLQNKLMLPVSEFKELGKTVTIYNNGYHDYSSELIDLIKESSENPDSVYLMSLITEIIRIGFDCEESNISIDRLPILFLTIMIYTAGDYINKNLQVDKVNQERSYQMRMKLLKHYGYDFNHGDSIWCVAWYWYQCRVVNYDQQEICRKYRLDKGIELDPAKIGNEIFWGDIAIGGICRNKKTMSK
jgi:hypothetical protein